MRTLQRVIARKLNKPGYLSFLSSHLPDGLIWACNRFNTEVWILKLSYSEFRILPSVKDAVTLRVLLDAVINDQNRGMTMTELNIYERNEILFDLHSKEKITVEVPYRLMQNCVNRNMRSGPMSHVSMNYTSYYFVKTDDRRRIFTLALSTGTPYRDVQLWKDS